MAADMRQGWRWGWEAGQTEGPARTGVGGPGVLWCLVGMGGAGQGTQVAQKGWGIWGWGCCGAEQEWDGLCCCRDGVLCPPFRAGVVGQCCWVPMLGHLASSWHAAMARHCQSSFSLSLQLWQQGQILPLARVWCRHPFLQPVSAAGLKSPRKLGKELLAPCRARGPGRNRQRWLTVGVGRQRGCQH